MSLDADELFMPPPVSSFAIMTANPCRPVLSNAKAIASFAVVTVFNWLQNAQSSARA